MPQVKLPEELILESDISAATDNAKELILAKINAGSNFARMYVYLIMTGYNFDDIVSFMISPASEFIDSMSNSNMFQDSDLKNSPNQAINLAMGKIKSYSFLHGSVSEWNIDETTGDKVETKTKKSDFVKRALESHSLYDDILPLDNLILLTQTEDITLGLFL